MHGRVIQDAGAYMRVWRRKKAACLAPLVKIEVSSGRIEMVMPTLSRRMAGSSRAESRLIQGSQRGDHDGVLRGGGSYQ